MLMIYIFYFFSILLIWMSWKSFRGGLDYLNFFKREIAKPSSDFAPFVSIIAPCRGLEDALEENLAALFEQDFPRYEVIFVVDNENDEAVEVIRKVSRRGAKDAKLIVAGETTSESQKVHNLREAVLHIAEESEVFVFVDSDARPNADWLKNLIAPLEDEKIGAASAYRWFISKKMNFGSEMRAVWNASIASALGENLESNFCWGGSMAVGRKTFEELNIRERWRGTLSDDFAVTRAMKEARRPIYFVPQALAASVEDCSFRECLEFTTRQMKITRVYAPHLWLMSLLGSFCFNLVFVWGILILIWNPVQSFAFGAAVLTLLAVTVFSISKAWLRLKAVKLVLKGYESDIKKQFRTQTTLWILSPALFFYNAVCALFSRRIIWRGIRYRLNSATKTDILSN